MAVPAPGDLEDRKRRRAPTEPSAHFWWPRSGAVLIVVPEFILLYALDQKNLLPEESN